MNSVHLLAHSRNRGRVGPPLILQPLRGAPSFAVFAKGGRQGSGRLQSFKATRSQRMDMGVSETVFPGSARSPSTSPSTPLGASAKQGQALDCGGGFGSESSACARDDSVGRGDTEISPVSQKRRDMGTTHPALCKIGKGRGTRKNTGAPSKIPTSRTEREK